jgi:hypothetical protein
MYAKFMGEKAATTSSKVYKLKKNWILILDNSPVETTKWRRKIFGFSPLWKIGNSHALPLNNNIIIITGRNPLPTSR